MPGAILPGPPFKRALPNLNEELRLAAKSLGYGLMIGKTSGLGDAHALNLALS
ncbi:hypothetical protein LZC95_23380 [Pendulispora brunnea]|uniref:Uncharacterized protein n=1 Tax=Pendulispora brunnea TaxID=2905690 RepID=A0ABZ2KQ80_9BACT